MRRIFLLLALLILFSFGMGPTGILSGSYGVKVFAQGVQFTLPGAGITPDSPFYFLDRLGEFLQEFFTFSPEGKAHLQITFAAERIAEIKVVLKMKGVEARGLDVAQSRLRFHLARAATVITEQKGKGKDVSGLAREVDDEFDGPKSALAQTFKEQERALEAQKDELKTQLKAAHRAGDTAQEEAIAAQLGQVKAQLELLELREEDIEKELEAEEERIEEEMEAQYKAEKAIGEAEEELAELQEEAAEEGIEVPAEALVEFNSFLSQAQALFEAGDFQEARRLAKQAEKSLEQVEDVIEELEEKKEAKEEAEEAIQEAEGELEKIKTEAEEKGIVVSSATFGEFNSLISQARAALGAENYKEAKRLAKEAEKTFANIEAAIEELEKAKEKEAELQERLKEQQKETEEELK